MTILIEPSRIVKLPYINSLREDQLIKSKVITQNHFYSYTIKANETVYPKTFALSSNVPIIDYIGIKCFSVWIIEPRRIFLDGDHVIAQTKNHRLYTGKSKLLTSHSLILRNNDDINCGVLDFADLHFIGRFARGIGMNRQ
ncbi:hypothetical protein NBRC111894_622 [Sporolactobacillus inulinus]|uniref:Uncharacterized protein n=1 Tax=Sporolactobacillus inulinus TaxID=2078 RepID=A0A4Y1Z7Z6_9BACL|nr:hypothetical protein [Sporolactobacillus inulinus]GAY75068.1 hypothetical protein NBRC111894_622 [Sporolactobacillus inulinus]